MQNTYQEKILDLENTNNSINKKLEGGIKFKIKSNFQPAGDQPQAIKKLISNLKGQKNEQVLLGVTGSGKTFTRDEDGKDVTIDQSLVDAARVELNKLNYQKSSTGQDGSTDTIYPPLGEQFDLLFKDIAAGTLTTSGNLYTALKATKDKYPKP